MFSWTGLNSRFEECSFISNRFLGNLGVNIAVFLVWPIGLLFYTFNKCIEGESKCTKWFRGKFNYSYLYAFIIESNLILFVNILIGLVTFSKIETIADIISFATAIFSAIFCIGFLIYIPMKLKMNRGLLNKEAFKSKYILLYAELSKTNMFTLSYYSFFMI